MKKNTKPNLVLLILWLVGTVASVLCWIAVGDVPLMAFCVPFLPAFCSQLLMCRITKNGWLRALPALPIPILLGFAGWYDIFGSGWDRLAALIFAFAAIAPFFGILAGWITWWIQKGKLAIKLYEEK